MTGYHTAHLSPDPLRSVVWKVIADHLSRWVPPNAHVLEIGAGYCDWVNHVSAARRVAVDVWPEIRTYAAAGVEPVILDASSQLRTLGASVFDVVLASNVLEHFEPSVALSLVSDVATVLKPGGRFVIIQPNFRHAWRRYFDDYTHRAVFTDVSLPALLQVSGFDIDLVKTRFLPYSMRGALKSIRPWMVRAYLHSPVKPMAGQMLVIAHTRAVR